MRIIGVLIVKILFEEILSSICSAADQSTMPTYDRRVLLLLNATQELPVDLQMEILKHYPRPKVSPRMQGFLDRWKARNANV